MLQSRRLSAVGVTLAIIVAACSGSAATPVPPASVAAAGSPSDGQSAAPVVDWKACASFDAAGLGDKGFNDLAQKGLEDAKAAGFQTAYTEAKGAGDYAVQHPATDRRGLPDDRHRRHRADAGGDRGDARQRRHRLRTGRRDLGRDCQRADTRRTSRAWTSRSTRRRRWPDTSAAGFSKSKIVGTYGGEQYPGRDAVPGRLLRRDQDLQRAEGRRRQAPRLECL